MTDDQFNAKWVGHLETGHYGMSLMEEDQVKYVDEKFEELLKECPTFTYSQIKMKFGMARVYLEDGNDERGTDIWKRVIAVSNDIERGINQLEKERINRSRHSPQQ